MTEYEYIFTIFTPTYNRADTLPRLYESLCNQSFPFDDFEWLIVDDNSEDGTKDLVSKWKSESPFDIRFITQSQGESGKHRAFNKGVECSRGKLFSWEDSDDASYDDRLKILYNAWIRIPEEFREDYAGVMGLSTDKTGEILGNELSEPFVDSDFIERKYIYDFGKEVSGFIRTDILEDYPMPDVPERFVPEGIVWYKISENYDFRFINDPVTIIHDDGRVDRLTIDINPSDIAIGHSMLHRIRLNNHLNWFWRSPLEFVLSAIRFNRFSFHCGKLPHQYLSELNYHTMILLCILMVPASTLLFIRDWYYTRNSSN